MFTLPFLAYYVAATFVFAHKANPDNWAAAVAIGVTNLIVGVYCYSAFMEDDEDPNDPAQRARRNQYKERTD